MPPDPQAKLLDGLTDDQVLDALGPDWSRMSPAARARYGPPTAPNEDEPAPSGTGPGLLDRDIPPPGCDEAPAPHAPDDLSAAIADETDTVLDRCERKLLALEAKYVNTPTAQYRRALTAGRNETRG